MTTPATTSAPDYRHGARAFADLRREHGFEPLRVRGRLPSDLCGTLYFNGPGSFTSFGERSPFWLDGDGALTAVRIGPGNALGAMRMVGTRSYRAEQAAGRRLYSRFERRSPRPVREFVLGDARNAGNTSVWHLQEQFYALCPQGSPVRFDPGDLRTLGEHNFASVGARALSAHASYSRRRRAFYNFAQARGRKPTLELFEFPDAGGDRKLTEVALPAYSFIHDFMVTDRHALFVVPPFRIEALPALLQLRTISQCFHFRADQPAELIAIALDAPHAVTRIELAPCFVLHFANAFERDGEIVLDLPLAPHAAQTWRWLSALGRGEIVPAPDQALHRMHVDLDKRRVRCEPLTSGPEEQPRISPLVENQAYEFAYLAGFAHGHSGLTNALRKVSVESGKVQQLDLGSEQYPSEAVFVPRDGATSEDDGYLLTLVYDALTHTSYLAVLDARSFSGEPIASLHFAQHVPPPFHGTFVDARWSAPHPPAV